MDAAQNLQESFPVNSKSDIYEYARTIFSRAGKSHGWDHTLRVWAMSKKIGITEGADIEVIKIAALLHDIGRTLENAAMGAICHAKKGAEMARTIIAPLDLNPDKEDNIIHCIRAHRFRDNLAPSTLEAKVIFDADKLDSIGAIGVARAFQFAGEVGAASIFLYLSLK